MYSFIYSLLCKYFYYVEAGTSWADMIAKKADTLMELVKEERLQFKNNMGDVEGGWLTLKLEKAEEWGLIQPASLSGGTQSAQECPAGEHGPVEDAPSAVYIED